MSALPRADAKVAAPIPGDLASCPVRACRSTSFFTIRPSGPVPTMVAGSIPAERANRFASGLTNVRAESPSGERRPAKWASTAPSPPTGATDACGMPPPPYTNTERFTGLTASSFVRCDPGSSPRTIWRVGSPQQRRDARYRTRTGCSRRAPSRIPCRRTRTTCVLRARL